MFPVSVKLAGTCKQVQESTSHFLIKKVKALAKSQLRDHLLLCSHDLSFDSFTILAQETIVYYYCFIRNQRKFINQV